MQTINPNSFHFIHNNNNNSSDIDIVDSNDHNITFTMHRYLQPIIKNSSSSSSKKTTTKTFDDDFELKDSEQEELKRTNKDDYDNAIDIDNQPTSLPSPTIQSRQTSSTIQQQPQQQQQQQSSSAWRLGSSTCVLGERIAVVDSLEFYKGLKIKGIDYYTDSTVLLSFNDGNGGQNNNKPSVYKISSFYENITNKQLFIELIIVQRSDECGKKSSSAKQLFPTKRSISVKVTDITRITMCTIEPENQIKSKPSLPMNGFFCSDADYAELINAKGKKRSMYDKIIFSTPTSSQIDEGNNSSTQVVDQDEITPTQKRKSDFIDLEEFDFNNNNNNSNNDPSKEKLSKTADVQVKSKKDNIIKDIEQEEEEEEKEDILKEKPRRLKRLKKAKDNNNISIDIDSENDDNAQGNNHTSTSSSQERKLILSPQKKTKEEKPPLIQDILMTNINNSINNNDNNNISDDFDIGAGGYDDDEYMYEKGNNNNGQQQKYLYESSPPNPLIINEHQQFSTTSPQKITIDLEDDNYMSYPTPAMTITPPHVTSTKRDSLMNRFKLAKKDGGKISSYFDKVAAEEKNIQNYVNFLTKDPPLSRKILQFEDPHIESKNPPLISKIQNLIFSDPKQRDDFTRNNFDQPNSNNTSSSNNNATHSRNNKNNNSDDIDETTLLTSVESPTFENLKLSSPVKKKKSGNISHYFENNTLSPLKNNSDFPSPIKRNIPIRTDGELSFDIDDSNDNLNQSRDSDDKRRRRRNNSQRRRGNSYFIDDVKSDDENADVDSYDYGDGFVVDDASDVNNESDQEEGDRDDGDLNDAKHHRKSSKKDKNDSDQDSSITKKKKKSRLSRLSKKAADTNSEKESSDSDTSTKRSKSSTKKPKPPNIDNSDNSDGNSNNNNNNNKKKNNSSGDDSNNSDNSNQEEEEEDNNNSGFGSNIENPDDIKKQVELKYSKTYTMDEAFNIFIQYIVSCNLDKDFINCIDEDEVSSLYFKEAIEKIHKLVMSKKEMMVRSSIWQSDFYNELSHRPFYHFQQVEGLQGKCKSCSRTQHTATYLVYLSGKSYDVNDFWNGIFKNPKRLKGTDCEERKIEYSLGSFCYKRSNLFHKLHHFPYKLFRTIKGDVRTQKSKHPDWSNEQVLESILQSKTTINSYFYQLQTLLKEADDIGGI